MTIWNITIGLGAEAIRLSNVKPNKYNVAPRTNQFEAVVNGVANPAWSTEGRGSFYLYWKDGADLYYLKVAGPGEVIAARQRFVVASDAWEEAQTTKPEAAPAAPKKGRPRKAKTAPDVVAVS